MSYTKLFSIFSWLNFFILAWVMVFYPEIREQGFAQWLLFVFFLVACVTTAAANSTPKKASKEASNDE